MKQLQIISLVLLLAAHAASEDVTAMTDIGRVVGELTTMKDGGSVRLFRGLPFALPPTGERRWAAPDTSLPHFAEGFQAKGFAASCPNVLWSGMPLCHTCSTRSQEPRWRNSEDCLYLNIMTPAGITASAKLPVAVFVHGGGSVVGWSGIYTNTSALARQGLIYVTVQYRLANLGFLSIPEAGLGGNYAVQDLIAALQWVKKRIGFFGGDPESVMVFGQSAGAQLVESLLLSPKARGLFKTAVLESSASVDNLVTSAVPADQFFASLNCSAAGNVAARLSCARGKPWQQVIDSTPFGSYSLLRIDGDVLPLQPRVAFSSGNYNRVPVITGYNLQEDRIGDYFSGAPFFSYLQKYSDATTQRRAVMERALRNPCCGQDVGMGYTHLSQMYASFEHTGYDLVSAAGTDSSEGLDNLLVAQFLQMHSRAYLYAFGAVSLSPALYGFGAMHLLELMFILNDTWLFDGHAMGKSEQELAASMGQAWASFAKRGIPGSVGPGAQAWPAVGGGAAAQTSNWYVIDLQGGSPVAGFKAEQFDFFCNWTGPPAPAPDRSTLYE